MQEVVFHELQLLHALQALLVRNADDRKREQGKQSTEAAFELQSRLNTVSVTKSGD